MLDLDPLIRDSDNIVQIGACDGVTLDPLWPVLRRRKVRCLRVEPHPPSFDRLRELHRRDEHIVCVRVAIDESAGTRTLRAVKPKCRTKVWHRGLATLGHSVNLLEGFGRDQIDAFEVETKTLGGVFSDAEFPTPDVLVTDCEGWDHVVVSQALELSRPRVVLAECLGRRARIRMNSLLRDYRLLGFDRSGNGLWKLRRSHPLPSDLVPTTP